MRGSENGDVLEEVRGGPVEVADAASRDELGGEQVSLEGKGMIRSVSPTNQTRESRDQNNLTS